VERPLEIRGRVDHKDPFHPNIGTSDVVTVLSDDRLLKDYERIRELLLGSHPELNSLSLNPAFLSAWTFEAIQVLLSRTGEIGVEELPRFALRSYDCQYMLQGHRNVAGLCGSLTSAFFLDRASASESATAQREHGVDCTSSQVARQNILLPSE